ncbi:hypothetical protein [Persicobacter sp. CCB-QB2]|uniref:hypothetical protein n=1 Tax=Persicobacter sp. CCB-QB2 TaxID=1561025 RepID=UPI0012F81DE2|nr:hypothetical protein [Persicobacter sp. CCB-QB2]
MNAEELNGMYTRIEVARMLNIHRNTLRLYMKRYGVEVEKRRLSIKDVKRIFEALGMG